MTGLQIVVMMEDMRRMGFSDREIVDLILKYERDTDEYRKFARDYKRKYGHYPSEGTEGI